MNRTTLALQVAIGAAFLIVAGVAAFRLLEWLFAGNIWLWVALITVPIFLGTLAYAVDVITERPE